MLCVHMIVLLVRIKGNKDQSINQPSHILINFDNDLRRFEPARVLTGLVGPNTLHNLLSDKHTPTRFGHGGEEFANDNDKLAE